MGNQACCAGEEDRAVTSTAADLQILEAQPVVTEEVAAPPAAGVPDRAEVPDAPDLGLPPVVDRAYSVRFDKKSDIACGGKLGMDVDYMEGRAVLPIMTINGGLAAAWNDAHPHTPLQKGDSIIQVNSIQNDSTAMLEQCKKEDVLEMIVRTQLTYHHLVSDLEKLITEKNCGPILMRLSWHDAGVYSTGKLDGGCPNAAMRFAEAGEGKFAANAGLTEVAIPLLSNISKKYCPALISNADLWALAANVAIRLMGGPDIPTRFGRVDAKSASDSVVSQEGRLPDGDKGAVHLREIFHAKGFEDKDIVALSGAHTVGKCHTERSGFDGAWTEQPLKFDNSYFKDLLQKSFDTEKLSSGKVQNRCPLTGCIMLDADLALVQDASFKQYVERYAGNQEAFFNDFSSSWERVQECGWTNLRDIL